MRATQNDRSFSTTSVYTSFLLRTFIVSPTDTMKNAFDDDFEHAWALLDMANMQIQLQENAKAGEIDPPQWLLSSSLSNTDTPGYEIIKQPSYHIEDDLPPFYSNYELSTQWGDSHNDKNQPFTASDWYIQTNCGPISSLHSRSSSQPTLSFLSSPKQPPSFRRGSRRQPTLPAAISIAKNSFEPKTMKRLQLRLRGSADAKENLLNEEINSLHNLLRQKDPTLADVHINDCTTLYRQISLCLEHQKCKKNKRKVAAAATYYTLKRHFNPSPKEIERIFDMDHKAVTDALKRVKHLAFRNPIEFGWLFAQERGETVLSVSSLFFVFNRLSIEFVSVCFAT